MPSPLAKAPTRGWECRGHLVAAAKKSLSAFEEMLDPMIAVVHPREESILSDGGPGRHGSSALGTPATTSFPNTA